MIKEDKIQKKIDQNSSTMKVSTTCLYRIVRGAANESELGLSYSFLKLGRQKEVKTYSEMLVERIRSDLRATIDTARENLIVVYIGGFGVPNAAALLARRVARDLGLPQLALQTGLSAHPDLARRYASLARRQRREVICHDETGNIDAPEIVNGKHTILIEDALVTGTLLRHACAKLAQAGARQIAPYVLLEVDCRGDSAFEDRLNRIALFREGTTTLANVLNAEGAVFTTRLVYLSLELVTLNFQKLLAKLSPVAKLNLYLCAIEYFGFRPPENMDLLVDALRQDFGIEFPNVRLLTQAASETFFEAVLDILEACQFRVPPESALSVCEQLVTVLKKARLKVAPPVVRKRPRLKLNVPVGRTGIEIREGGRSTIDITVAPPPTKLMAMNHFLEQRGYASAQGIYIGNQTSSKDERDGILTDIQGLTVMAVDEDQSNVIPEAQPIGPGMVATQKKLEELAKLPDDRLPVFVGLDVDDTILGRKIVVDVRGTSSMTKEDLLEDRMGIAVAIKALSRRGVHLVFLSDNSADSAQRRIVEPLRKVFIDRQQINNGRIDFYASGMVTKFELAGVPAGWQLLYDDAYGCEYRLSAVLAGILLDVLGGVVETGSGEVSARGLIGRYYTQRLAERGPGGRFELRQAIEQVYTGVQLGATRHGNLEYPVVQQRDLFADGSVAQISILPIVSSETVPEDEDERALLVKAIARALLDQ